MHPVPPAYSRTTLQQFVSNVFAPFPLNTSSQLVKLLFSKTPIILTLLNPMTSSLALSDLPTPFNPVNSALFETLLSFDSQSVLLPLWSFYLPGCSFSVLVGFSSFLLSMNIGIFQGLFFVSIFCLLSMELHQSPGLHCILHAVNT